ncbi:MAG: class I SAM-dependent methyltransferase [Candidatus Omnitrophica bacterium]|nr:class I SAM-dependent methyltransferase [Candidatus Omnitrophota bacterium]
MPKPVYYKVLMKKSPALGPELYSKNYYLHSLPGVEYLEKAESNDPAITETIRFGYIQTGHHVLDFGCGRGNLAIALAQRGCTVLGVDFSPNAINFAREYLKRFSKEIQNRVEFKQMAKEELNLEKQFDVIVFNQVYEHLHDWELEILIPKFKRALKSDGRLVISTPNFNYIRYLFPLKRLIEFPFKVIKQIARLIRGKSKHASSVGAFLREIFKIRYPESEHTQLHINLQTPRSIRNFMRRQGFQVTARCVDYHKNLLGLLMRPWWGETIWLACKPNS